MDRGIIALDIDGTITIDKKDLHPLVANCLNSLIQEGWELLFVTGRTFSFAMPVLEKIVGNYFLGVQNGAALLQMPEKIICKKHYLTQEQMLSLFAIFERKKKGFLIESGIDQGDVCYYTSQHFLHEEYAYIQERMRFSPEPWRQLSSLEELFLEECAVLKYFSKKKQMDNLFLQQGMNVVSIKDPFRKGCFLTHVNAPKASKATILEEVSKKGKAFPIIAAGDDYNDWGMLQQATWKIVMATAPKKLREMADIIAPPAAENGIVEALQQMVRRCRE